MDQGEMELFRIQTEVYRRALEARETLESFSQSMAIEQRVEMYVLVLVAICLCILFKILNVNNSPEKSLFYCSNQKFLEEFLKKAPELAEPYIPTRFWGYSGHLQTIIQVSQGTSVVLGGENDSSCYLHKSFVNIQSTVRESCNASTLWILTETIWKPLLT